MLYIFGYCNFHLKPLKCINENTHDSSFGCKIKIITVIRRIVVQMSTHFILIETFRSLNFLLLSLCQQKKLFLEPPDSAPKWKCHYMLL